MVIANGSSGQGQISVELTRVWDLRKTGQVSITGKGSAGISCIFFHPHEPTICMITVQGPLSVICLYNAVSGGKLSTVHLRGVAVAATFTRDGNQIVVAFKDWSILLLKPGETSWHKSFIFRKKEPKPTERLLLAVNPAPRPVVFFAAFGQSKLYIIYGALIKSKRSRLRPTEEKTYTSLKLDKQLVGLSGHPQDGHQIIMLFSDGTVQGYLIEQNGVKKMYQVGDASGGVYGMMGVMNVILHPFLPGSILILVAIGGTMSIYESTGRAVPKLDDHLAIKSIKRVHGMGIDKVSNLLLVFGESANGVLHCFAARVSGSSHIGLGFSPVAADFSHTATDVTQGKSGNGIIQVGGQNGSWIELWGATPAWAQGSGQIGAARPRIKNVQIQSVMGTMAAQVSASSGSSGPYVLMWGVSDESHPYAGASTGIVSSLHTSLGFWGGGNASEISRFKLVFPHHFYFVQETRLRSHALATGSAEDVATFTPPSKDGSPASAESVKYSASQRCWLVFFRKTGALNLKEEWVFTLVREDEVQATQPWFKSGISGTFVGPHDEFFCILCLDRTTLHVYNTKTVSGTTEPTIIFTIPTPGVLTPAIFPGPPIFQIPLPPGDPTAPATADPDAEEEIINLDEEVDEGEEAQPPKDIRTGYGVIMWVNKFRQIVMGSLTVAGEGGEGMDAGVISYGFIVGELGDGEVVIQAAWQKLQEDEEQQQAPNASTCGLLTNKKVMMFLANGYPVASYPPRNSPGMMTRPTSCLWVGPALLYLTESGEVMQLLWDGSTAMICGAPSTTGTVLMCAALADRILFLARDPDTWQWQITSRHAYVGHALLMGWASLGASGLMPPDWVHTHARKQMKTVVENFDTSSVSVPVARALVQSGYADVAKRVAERWPFEADTVKVACSVAAGDWASAEKGLLKEHQESVYYPAPAPKGSSLWQRFFSTALGAATKGHWDVAVKLLQACGEWEHALVVSGLAMNEDSINKTIGESTGHVTPARAKELNRLAERLIAASRSAGGAAPLVKPDESLLGDSPGTWAMAKEKVVPDMETSLGSTPIGLVRDGDVGRIAPLDRRDIKGYIFGASRATRASQSFSDVTGRLTVGGTDDGSGFLGGEMLQVGGKDDSDGDSPTRGGNIMQNFKDLIDGDGFSSSDDEEGAATGGEDILSDGGSSSVFGKKFRIQIKGKEEGQTATSAETLRQAAKNLRIGGLGFGPSLGPAGFANALKGATGLTRQDSLSSVSSSGTAFDVASTGGALSDHGQDPSRPPPLTTVFSVASSAEGALPRVGSAVSNLTSPQSGAPSPGFGAKGLIPPPPVPTAPPSIASPSPLVSPAQPMDWSAFDPFDPFSQQPGAQTQPTENASTLFARGVTHMESGNWAAAEGDLAKSLSASGASSVSAKGKQYLAAVMLMKARTGMPPPASAKLSRYAAALKIDGKHKNALVTNAIKENMAIGNYGYSATQLTWLITASVGSATSDSTASLQDQLNECDRRGAGNSDVPNDEDVDTFAEIVGAAGSSGDVEATVKPVISS